VIFTSQDQAALSARGIALVEAERQMALFKHPPAPAELARACTVGDGVLRLSQAQQQDYEAKGAGLLASGRVTKFVPAAGAATRMFQALQADPHGKAAQEVLDQWGHFAFAKEFQEKDRMAALLKRYATEPKALIPFHWHGDHSHSAFEDHLREAQALGIKEAHFSISAGQREVFTRQLEAMKPPGLEVTFSEQKSSTDTLAADERAEPFRDSSGGLVFRPGGHGALLENLNALNADILLIKNIDNISHSRLWTESLRWKKILLGLLLENSASDRPSRVCGVVKNTGEPGGGPFWVRRGDKVDRQLVESAQMNLNDPGQKGIFQSATHFNPVDIVASVKGFDLRQFRDNSAVFLSWKSRNGRSLHALELPGLWNGAMAEWQTTFVEVPTETFNPVKTVNDLLKPAHQPA
jgi:hypothetical protein